MRISPAFLRAEVYAKGNSRARGKLCGEFRAHHKTATVRKKWRSFRLLRALLAVCAAGMFNPVQIAERAFGAGRISAPEAAEAASHLVELSGAAGGICSVIGSKDASLAVAVSKQGRFIVHCLQKSREECQRLRREIRSLGMYGKVSAGTYGGGTLPYMRNLINVVFIESPGKPGEEASLIEEAARVLAPLGTVYLGISSESKEAPGRLKGIRDRLRSAGLEEISLVKAGGIWIKAAKPWPSGIDEWGHYLHAADGNPVAKDEVVGPPEHYQWTGEPVWMRSHETDSSISTMVTSGGRLFYIEDQAPISLAGNHPLPDKWFLVARDAFNGVFLWKVPIEEWGWRQWKHSWFLPRPGDIPLNIQKRLVAAGDKVYAALGYHAALSALDSATGEILRTYEGTKPALEILHLDGSLVLSVLEGDKLRVVRMEAASGRKLWTSQKAYGGTTVDYYRWRAMRGRIKPAKLDPTLNMATDGAVVALLDGSDVVALDFKTGKEKWRTAFPLVKADLKAGGIDTKGNLWVGTLIVKDGVVIHASPNRMAGFSADRGKLLWTRPKRYIGHLWYEWKDVFVIDNLVWTWGADLERSVLAGSGKRKRRSLYPTTVRGYNIKTGKLERKVGLGFIFKTHHHHRCYRNKATSRYILASRRGTEYVDLLEGNHTVHNWVRGTCHVGMMPANGLQYAPAHPCVCYINEKLKGMNVLAPAGSVEEGKFRLSRPRLTRGPAFGKTGDPDSLSAKEEDWPSFRSDSRRTGYVPTKVPDEIELLWSRQAGRNVSAPVVARGKVFVSLVDEHHVACFNSRDGSKLWEFAAGARVDSPPAYCRGTVVFGSADGCVYCLRAKDGQLVWRFFAAPGERFIGGFGQLESAWPVHGSVLVREGTAYFACGRSSQLDGGIWLYGLKCDSGEIRYKTHLEGPDYTVHELKENYRMPMGALTDILMSGGDTIFMHTEAFDTALNEKSGKPELRVKSTFLDGNYFKRVPWTFGGEYGRFIVRDKRSVYYVRMFDSLRGLDPSVYFTPGAKGYLLFARNMGQKKKAWKKRIPVRIRAMALTENKLFVAGPPDVLDAKDPLGAFEGRKGGLLYVIDANGGDRFSKHKLRSPPVFNGIAAACGRLYLVLKDGTVACFGRRSSERES